MGDVTPFQRKQSGPGGPNCRCGRKRHKAWVFPLIAGGFALLVAYSIRNTNQLPAAVQGVVSDSRDIGRKNSPPIVAYYPNCDAARAAGVAPLVAGEPGYRERLDADGDGVACEPYLGM